MQEPPLPDKRLEGSLASATLSNTSSRRTQLMRQTNAELPSFQFNALRDEIVLRVTIVGNQNMQCGGRQFELELRSGYLIRSTTFPRKKFVWVSWCDNSGRGTLLLTLQASPHDQHSLLNCSMSMGVH